MSSEGKNLVDNTITTIASRLMNIIGTPIILASLGFIFLNIVDLKVDVGSIKTEIINIKERLTDSSSRIDALEKRVYYHNNNDALNK